VYLTHRDSALQVNLRRSRAGTPLELEKQLREQQWAAPPVNCVTRMVGNIAIVAGTFPYPGGGWVREWYLSDTKSGANAAVPLPTDAPSAVVGACEELLDSVAFEVAGDR
jgi:hypothetical protein